MRVPHAEARLEAADLEDPADGRLWISEVKRSAIRKESIALGDEHPDAGRVDIAEAGQVNDHVAVGGRENAKKPAEPKPERVGAPGRLRPARGSSLRLGGADTSTGYPRRSLEKRTRAEREELAEPVSPTGSSPLQARDITLVPRSSLRSHARRGRKYEGRLSGDSLHFSTCPMLKSRSP